ncbi:MAG: zinc ribbon domain-containing protein [Balneolaceae bacterium]|nr:zinc ribbon domain-containing protein [Balneolaceae bacterium]
MPTYEYKREDGTTFEKLQGINDAPLTECPETGQKVRRIISGGAGVVYKGTGFYVTDYKNGNGSSKKSTDNGSEKSSESKETAPKAEKE